MQLPNPKDLKALLKVCRAFGVDSMEVGELKVKFGEMPRAGGEADQEEAELAPDGLPLPPGITLEQFENWSSAPDPREARFGAQ